MLSGQKITFTLSTRENIFLWSEKYKLSLLKASISHHKTSGSSALRLADSAPEPADFVMTLGGN